MMMSDINGSQGGAGSSSPKSFDGRTLMNKEQLTTAVKKQISDTNLSDSDDIQMQFEKYQSQADNLLASTPERKKQRQPSPREIL